MVFTTSMQNDAVKRLNITPFQHWFNKNQVRLKEECGDEDLMKYAQNQYDKK